MVLLGAELIEKFEPVLLGFAVLLLFSSWKLLTRNDQDGDADLSHNNIVQLCRCGRLRLVLAVLVPNESLRCCYCSYMLLHP